MFPSPPAIPVYGRTPRASAHMPDPDDFTGRPAADGRSARGRKMGRELGCRGARPLSGRQLVGTTSPKICLSVGDSRCERPDLQTYRAAKFMGPTGATAPDECL